MQAPKILFILFVLFFVSLSEAQKLKLENLISDQTLAYWTLDNLAALKNEAKTHPTLKVFNESWFQALLADPIKKFEDEIYSQIQSNVGLTLAELASIPSGQISLIFHDFKIQEGQEPGPEHLSASIVLEFSESHQDKVLELLEKLVKFIESNLQKGGEELVLNDMESHGGKIVELTFVKEDGAARPEKMYYGLRKQCFIIGIQNKDEIESFFSALSGGSVANSLAQSELGREMLAAHSPNSFTRGFFNLRRLYEIILVSSAEMAPMIQMYAPILGLDKLNSASFSVSLEGDLMEATLFVSCPGQKQGIMKLFDVKSGDLTPPSSISANSTGYGTCYFSLTDLFDEVTQKIGEVDPNTLAQVEAGLQQVKEATQLDVREDIIGSFGDRFSFISYNSLTGSQMPEMVILMELADTDKFKRAKDILLQMAGLGGVLIEENYLGKTLWAAELGVASPAYMIDGNNFCLSFTKGALKNYIRQVNEPGNALVNLPAYQQLSSHVLSGAGVMLFSNILDEEAWNQMLEEAGKAQLELLGVDASKLPTYEQAKPYMSFSISTYRSDEKGFLLKSVSAPNNE